MDKFWSISVLVKSFSSKAALQAKGRLAWQHGSVCSHFGNHAAESRGAPFYCPERKAVFTLPPHDLFLVILVLDQTAPVWLGLLLLLRDPPQSWRKLALGWLSEWDTKVSSQDSWSPYGVPPGWPYLIDGRPAAEGNQWSCYPKASGYKPRNPYHSEWGACDIFHGLCYIN